MSETAEEFGEDEYSTPSLFSSSVGGDEDSPSSDSEGEVASVEGGGTEEVVSSLEQSWSQPATTADSALNLLSNQQELIQQRHLRKHIENLEAKMKKKEEIVDKFRKQSFRCQEQQSLLLGEKNYLEEVMINSPRDLMGIVHGRVSKLMLDMEAESELEEELKTSLTKAEEELLEAQMAVGHYDHFKEKLERIGAAWTGIKEKKFTDRVQAEAKLVENARRKEATRERQTNIFQEQAAANLAVEEGKRASRDERMFMQTALSQHKAARAKQAEETKRQKHLEKRMKAILKLKNNITSSEGTIQAKRLLKQERERKEQVLEELERNRVLEESGVPEEHFLRKKRFQKFQGMLENFKKKKEERTLDIVEKLLKEEKLDRQAKRKHAHDPDPSEHFLHSGSRKTPKRDVLTAPSDSRGSKEAPEEGGARREVIEDSDLSDNDMLGDYEHTLRDKALISIVEPEITGLWEKTPIAAPPPKPGTLSPVKEGELRRMASKRRASKAEVIIMKKAMEKLKDSKIQEQVAAGKKFKGKPFSTKPHVVVFRNFDVGKVYTKKVKLTNVSYTVNRLQYEGVSTTIVNFITVTFDPPGSMSAGMSCNMLVSFTPQVDEDLEGDIELMSQTGPYSIHVKCLTKKCLVGLDKTALDFGVLCVGETYRQNAMVLNAGALGTEYTITPLLHSPSSILKQLTAPTIVGGIPDGVIPDADAPNKLAHRSNYSIMTTVEPLKNLDTSMGEGVILPDSCANRFKSKSSAQICFTEPQDTPQDEQNEQDKQNEQNQQDKHNEQDKPDKDQAKAEKAQNKSQRPKSKEKSRPGSKGKVHPKSGEKSRPTSQEKSCLEKSEKSEQKHQDTPSILLEEDPSALPASQDTPQPMSQDVPQLASQDTENQDAGKQRALSESSGVAEGKLMPAFSITGADHKEAIPESRGSLRPPAGSTWEVVTPYQQQQESGPPAIKIGSAPSGWVPPFGSKDIELVFSPSSVGQHVAKFLISFSHPTASSLEVTASGCGSDVPVYVEQKVIDMRICLLDRLYQSSVVLRSRASTSIQVSFQVPPDLQPYLEVLPKHGVVQDNATFAAQVKFKPLESLFEQDMKDRYYLASEDVYRMPVHVGVANQFRPAGFTVLAYVTPSELRFSPTTLDFDCCTIHESIYSTLTVTNTSIVPQRFGFIDLPDCVDIQPDDGFGEVLPTESLDLDVTFSAKKPRPYQFELVCQSLLGKTYRIGCKGRGILPPLELSKNVIKFVATPLGSTTTVRIKIRNPKLSRMNSAVIRGAAPPQGPKAFQFMPMPGCPISFSPQVGVVSLGKETDVQIQFSPKLSDESIREEALRLSISRSMARMDSEGAQKKGGKRRKSITAQASPLVSSFASLVSQNQSTDGESKQQDNKILPEKGTLEWEEACRSLILSFENNCMEFSIPCFVSDTVPSDDRAPLTYRPEHTLYLRVTAPAVRPSLMLVKGQSPLVDFGSIGTGDVTTKKVAVVNITSSPLKLQCSVLNPCGPFQLRNALRPIAPEGVRDLLLWFSPQVGGKTCDTMVLHSEGVQVLQLRLVGIGIHPQIDLSLGTGKNLSLDLGHAMAKDVVSKTFTLLNSSPINVRFHLSMETQLVKNGLTKSFRACNYSGQPPFVCVPSEGVVTGDESKEVRVFFSPDHQSKAYSDRLMVYYNEKCGCSVVLTGKAWTNNMYLRLVSEGAMVEDFPADAKESMIPAAPPPVAEDSAPPLTHPLLIMFTHSTGASAMSSKQVMRREIEIGCIKSNLVKKSTGDFSIDVMATSNPFAKCFTFETTKGFVEAGSAKNIAVTFALPKDVSCSLVAANVTLTLKGNITQVYQLLLRALICE